MDEIKCCVCKTGNVFIGTPYGTGICADCAGMIAKMGMELYRNVSKGMSDEEALAATNAKLMEEME